ncbi:MAG: D-aminoacyl-tRNA deacylase [Bacteroidales bacterium]|nr:D-aminoacyl-tRNA deacylase [Bacteroidales bacterium]
MRAVIQRVSHASVTIEGVVKAKIEKGLLVLLGIEDADSQEDIDWLAGKIARLRIFSDENDLMNLSIDDVSGDMIVVSQFTLFAATKKGNRPSYIRAARPETAIPLYESFVETIRKEIKGNVQTGEFGADMKVELLNDGPTTILIDTKNKE